MAKKFSKVEEQYENEEKYVQPLSKNNLDDEMFDVLDAALVDETKLPIDKIVPDHTQPRRIIPNEFLHLLVEKGITAVIEAWEEYVLDATKDFPIIDIIEGKERLEDFLTDDPLVIGFGKLISFAANIHDVGLNHPIGVVTRGNVYRIVFGERRWTTFQFLQHYIGGYERIPSKVANVSEWELAKAQASENFQTDPLNAISKARQFAKLLMIARSDGGERYDSWNQLVNPGGCDRPWYAQVANGEIHRIPRGMGPQFSQALNVSEDTMRKYRSLLKLFSDHKLAHQVNDAIWMLGDAGNWAEGFMRDIGQYLQVDDVDTILNGTGGYTVTVGTVSLTEDALREAVAGAKIAAESKKKHPTPTLPVDGEGDETPPVDKSLWASYAWVGREAMAGPVKVFVTNCTAPETVMVQYPQADGTVKEVPLNIFALEPVPSNTPPQPQPVATGRGLDNADTPKPDVPSADTASTYRDKNGVLIWEGDTVKTRRGVEAVVIGFTGRYVNVSSGNPYLPVGHYPETLEVTAKAKSSDIQGAVESWQGKIVSTVVGAVAKVVEDNGAEVRIQFPPGHFAKQRKEYLTVLPESEWVAAVNLHLAQTPQQSGLEKSVYPDDLDTLKGRRVGYKGDAAIIVAKSGEGKVYIQWGKERIDVAVDELDFDYPPAMESKAATDTPQLKGLVLATDDVMRRYLEPYRMLSIVLDNEHATNAIEWLLNLTYERTNRQQLESAMNHVIDHVEEINATVESIVFEQFRLKLDELN